MSPELSASIAQAVLLITEGKQEQDKVHELIVLLASQAHTEGYLAGLAKAQGIVNRHMGSQFA